MIVKGYCQIAREYQNKSKAEVIGNRIFIADGFFSRLKGLLGRKGLDEGEGLLLSPCSSIHCWGMRFPIDAIFLDKQYRVVAIHPNLKPGSMASHRQARYVLELKAGEASRHNIQIREQLVVATDNLKRGGVNYGKTLE